jgi:hypothetical protein
MYQPYPGRDTQLPEIQLPPVPAPVRNAARAMYAGAAASLLGIAVDLLTLNDTRAAIEKHSPGVSASHVSATQHTLLAGFVAEGLIAAVIWAVLARFCLRGRNWARIRGTLLFGVATVRIVVGLTAPVADAVKAWSAVVWLAGLIAIVLLWRPAATAFFRRELA